MEAIRDEVGSVDEEIDGLRDAARRKVWEAIVQTREIHARLCDANVRLEHLQLDIRERTGEVRLPSIPMPFVDFLLTEIRRFVVVPGAVESDRKLASVRGEIQMCGNASSRSNRASDVDAAQPASRKSLTDGARRI